MVLTGEGETTPAAGANCPGLYEQDKSFRSLCPEPGKGEFPPDAGKTSHCVTARTFPFTVGNARHLHDCRTARGQFPLAVGNAQP